MIILDYVNLDLETCELGPDNRKWTNELAFGAFFGGQIIKVNGVDFSADYPLLGFSRELNSIAHHLVAEGKQGVYHDPYFESPYVLHFSPAKDGVLISHRTYEKVTFPPINGQ